MAKKPKGKPAAPRPGGGGGGSPLARNALLIIVGALLFFLFMPTVLFLAFAMLPTFVAVVIDKGNKRYGGITVGGLNFAGAAPYVLELWMGLNDITAALNMLSDVFALMLIYGCAGFGWLLYTGTPSTVTAFMSMTSSRRLQTLKAKQKALIEEWGQEVAASDEFEEIGSARRE